MKHRERIAGYRQLRERPLWKLLAADHAPELIGLLQGLLLDGERRLPSSVLHERLQRQLDALRADELSRELPRTAQAYVAHWLAQAESTVLVAQSEQGVVGLAVLLTRVPSGFAGAVPRKVIEVDNLVVRFPTRGALFTRRPDVAQRAKLALGRGNNLLSPLSELQAAVLLPQLEMLADRNERRAGAVRRLAELLADVPGLRPFVNDVEGSPAYYKVGLRYDASAFGLSRERLVKAMRAEGVALDEGFRALHVGRNEIRAVTLRFQEIGKFAGGGRFARTLQTHEHDRHRRLGFQVEFGVLAAEHFHELVVHDLDELLTGAHAL